MPAGTGGTIGYEKSAELTSTTNGCACVAVLMAMPEELRVKVDTIGMEISTGKPSRHLLGHGRQQ